VLFYLRPQQEARFVFFDGPIIRQLLASRLHGKIRLPQRDKRFAWIGVLDYEIAGITRERPVFELAFCSRTNADHIGNFNEMVANHVAALLARFPRLRYDGDEIAEVGVLQHPRQFAGRPKLAATFVGALDPLEGIARGRGW
jgi:hypothetical protein